MIHETQDWKDITSEELRPATRHVQQSFDTAAWRISEITSHLAYAALHPAETHSVEAYTAPFQVLRGTLSKAVIEEFDVMVRMDTEPAFFRAHLDIYRRGLEVILAHCFNEVIKVATANQEFLKIHPAEWTSLQVKFLIGSQRYAVKNWVMDVCDPLDLSQTPHDSDNPFNFRRSWRAPRLIHMQPSGNTPYDKATAWQREDEARTTQLRDALRNDFLLFLEIFLEKVTGEAHLRSSQQKNHQEKSYVSKAPRPIQPVRGNYCPAPNPAEPLLDFPPSFPRHLVPRANVIIHAGIERFGTKNRGLEICDYVLQELIPYLIKEVKAGKLDEAAVLDLSSDLVRYLLISNSESQKDIEERQVAFSRSGSWIKLSNELVTDTDQDSHPDSDQGSHTPSVPSTDTASPPTDPEADAAEWEKVRISFLSEERVQIWQGSETKTLNYAEFGFADGRDGKPSMAWEFLRALAEDNGTVDTIRPGARTWSRVEKRVQTIRSVLRREFSISSDPLPFIRKVGYQARFKIHCKPSYDS
jgi:hypothetical protein